MDCLPWIVFRGLSSALARNEALLLQNVCCDECDHISDSRIGSHCLLCLSPHRPLYNIKTFHAATCGTALYLFRIKKINANFSVTKKIARRHGSAGILFQCLRTTCKTISGAHTGFEVGGGGVKRSSSKARRQQLT